ncbi:MAG: aspartyl protease family protein [Phycisphaerales bacterium]|nr:aspartyl protease family protein [Hyphomonadaceae bacterium]
MGAFGRFFAMLACAAGLATAASAECLDAPDLAAYQTARPEDFALGPTRSDRLGRVVAPVIVNGHGPYRFIVDTGANRSVVSQTLAEQLGLTPVGTGQVHSVHGVSTAQLVDVDSLRYGEMSLAGESLPMLHGAVLAGEHGLLGVDGMRGRRLRMDFDRNCIEIVPSEGARRLRGWASIRGELRFGHLVVVRGSINGVRVNLLIDTGSDSSLANNALRDALNARVRDNRQRVDYAIAYTAGDRVILNRAMLVQRLSMGELEVRNITAFVGDFHIFNFWGLQDEPTLLVGMDVLSQARGLAIDYGRGTVHLRPRDNLYFGTRVLN